MKAFRRVAALKTVADFLEYLEQLQPQTPALNLNEALSPDETLEPAPAGPLAQALTTLNGRTIGNRWGILPMEGWDGGADGRPTDLVRRRWGHFGQSGAKLIWGGEAVAVRQDGRANPHQLMINDQTLGDLAALREHLVTTHREHHGASDDLLLGLQLTHSGRFARPNREGHLEPWILYHHPILDKKFGLADNPDARLMSDDEIEALVADFVRAATQAHSIGFDFVDLKHCHGYLGHEFLSAVDRPGKYGGSIENRTRFLREIVEGIRREAPGLVIGVRLSAFDFIPFRPGQDGRGEPESWDGRYPYAFGGDGTGTGLDLEEPSQFLSICEDLGIDLVCLSAGSPYYVPHIQRPALFPPSDGYQPPEDPLVGVARQVLATAELKRRHPGLIIVGSALTYLQEWLPNVAQSLVRRGMMDLAGIGRMVLSYPELPADVLAGRSLQRRAICRTFSDCTTAPRNGMVSGCFPLDDFYKHRPEADRLKELKKG